MASPTNKRIKYGYLDYNDIQNRIEEGILDAYDVVYTKDTHECYIITESLSPVAINSRVYRYDSVSDAIKALNESPDTYEGQIVAIKANGHYKGYIVNLTDDKFNVNLLSEIDEKIDYNTLGNRPIINLTGTLAEPVIVENLSNGIYSISGQYQLFSSVQTIFSSFSNHIFLVEKSDTETYIKDISAKKITTYINNNDGISSEEIVTSKYLENNHYMTESDTDKKIQALNALTKTEATEYVQSVVADYLDTVLDERIEKKIDAKIVEADDSSIDNMFANND